MTNTVNFDYNNKTFQDVSVKVMNEILDSDATGSSMDDLYKTACKYRQMTREQFEVLYKQAKDKLQAWTDEGAFDKKELSDEDLSMVVGGSMGSFLDKLGEGISAAAKATGNFLKENAAVLGLVLGVAEVCVGVGLLVAGNPLGAGLVTTGVVTIGISAGNL